MFSPCQIFLSATMTIFSIVFGFYWTYKLKKKFNIADKIVMVTGSCTQGGLGINLAALARTYGAKTLIVTSRDEVTAVEALKYLECVEGKANVIHVNLDLNWSEEQIESTIDKLWRKVGSIDLLIANAGVSYRGETLSTSDEVHKRIMQSNHFGNVSLVRAVVKRMMALETLQPRYIVGISSVQGRISIPYRSAYSASKHAFNAYLDCLRAEVAKYDIGVLTVCPSYINTNLSKNAVRDSGEKHSKLDSTTAHGMQPEEVACKVYGSLRRGESELMLLDLKSKIALYLRTLFPFIFFLVMEKRAKSSAAY